MRASLLALLIVLPFSALAEQPLAKPASDPTAPPPAGSNWQHVQALPTGTPIHLSTRKQSVTCEFAGADTDTLNCIHQRTMVFERTDVKSVKLARRGRSTLVAAAIGAGAGAGIGAASGSSCSQQEKNSFLGCFLVVNRGSLALAGSLIFGAVGAPMGYFTDFSRSTVYKAP